VTGSRSFRDDWNELTSIVEGRSHWGRSAMAVTKARELAATLSERHQVAVTISPSKLTWLRGRKRD